MCGIAGYIGWHYLPQDNINKTLNLMKRRGPDFQDYKVVAGINDESHQLRVVLLHSRLSIIDLSTAANQPYSDQSHHLTFNGELYNYLELKDELKKTGTSFTTNSDTEVLLKSYQHKGLEAFKDFEGMWAVGIWDDINKMLVLSRDRFGEKPLYYHTNEKGLYFASEIKALMSLVGKRFSVNNKHLYRYLFLGYRSLYKSEELYFNDIKSIPCSTAVTIQPKADSKLEFKVTKYQYWKLETTQKNISYKEALEQAKHYLFESIKIRLRSDVPLAFCLSGGVDSSTLVSVARIIFGVDLKTFSIIDSDHRYNESENIKKLTDYLKVDNISINLNQQDDLQNLRELIKYHDAPIATISYFIHSFLSKAISEQGYRVAFSGTGADEIYTGYYDHYLLQLHELRNHPNYNTYLKDWETHVNKFIRNPLLKNPLLFSNNQNFRDHLYDNSAEFLSWIITEDNLEFETTFNESQYSDSLLRNRMQNELFHEIVPVILNEDDLNSMYYSVENRSPYLDSKLIDFIYSIPSEFLIQNGYAKYLLRESGKDIVPDDIRLDRNKKGFNASINSVFNLNSDEIKSEILDEGNMIFNILNRDKVVELFSQEFLPNHYSKFIFNLLNINIFMEEF